jgi:carbamoyl-phosphate synthase small subunit
MNRTQRRPAVLYLESGLRFDGYAFGATDEVAAEVVFNTSMTGYQEILTDPSYAGQMVTLTNPLIGNYGARAMDEQARGPQAAALIVRELSAMDSNYASEEPLGDYLARAGVPGIEGIDTRGLVLHLRRDGAMNGILSSTDFDDDSLRARLAAAPKMKGRDLVKDVTIAAPYEFEPRENYAARADGRRRRVVAIDYGVKRNILELLHAQGFHVTVVSAKATAAEVLALEPEGVFCSNGPGDPAAVTYAIETLRGLIGRVPIFGICLGHQLLALALGAKTYKLKFGHRGGNHPVRDEATGRIEITSQNHGFCVDAETMPEDLAPTHWNLNDGTLEGFRHRRHPLFCVQYHPEAAPGPHDSAALFGRFREMVEGA